MNNKTFSQQTIDYAKNIKKMIMNNNTALTLIQANNISALFALGAAAAHARIIRPNKPNKAFKFNGLDMNDFFREVSLKINAFGDDEAKALVRYAAFNSNTGVNFSDGIHGTMTNFSIGVTYYFNEVKGNKCKQKTYYYEDKNNQQYVANIQII